MEDLPRIKKKEERESTYCELTKKHGLADLFSRISSTYDLINHLLTFGLDTYWRWQAVKKVSNFEGSFWLDVCTGPGNMARLLARQGRKEIKIVALDFSWPMLCALRRKKNPKSRLLPLMAQAASLPFKSDSIDLITLAFATRNLFSSSKHLLSCFQEFHRVLRPGGLYLNLETSQPNQPFLRQVFHFYVRKLIKPIGRMISGDEVAYSYLANTIPRFLNQIELKSLLIEAGFKKVDIVPLTGGIVAVHLAYK
ncbi:MAG: ubiquinone/menaquinone biosynthesis methyltransferase [Candidatus Aminicenantes bacterium]|nr:ubiquinone/menaquinone biosynthesis methyltransferase [Candidatus Aminicenantes bacterium]